MTLHWLDRLAPWAASPAGFRKGLTLAALALAAMSLSACSLIPGMKLDAPQRVKVGATEQASGGSDYPIQPITGEFVQKINQRRRVPASEASQRRKAPRDYQYRVGRGDVLSIIVWNHPELTNPFGEGADAQTSGRLVHQNGTLFFPFVGPIEAAGKTTQQIQDELAAGLKSYVQQPQVNVRVQEFRSKRAYVTGEVRQPGPQAITDTPLTVLDAISAAGGFTRETSGEDSIGADARRALLTRDGRTVPINLLELYETGVGDRVLQDGDILHVPDDSDNKVFVMGQVRQQSTVAMHEGELTLAEALAGAKGIDLQTADTERIYVIRGVPKAGDDGDPAELEPRIFRLDARDPTSLLLADSFPMQPRDVVFVSAPGIIRWNRVLEQIMPSIRAGYRIRAIESGFE